MPPTGVTGHLAPTGGSIHIHIHTHIHIHIRMCIHIHIHIYIHMHKHKHKHIHMYTCKYMFISGTGVEPQRFATPPPSPGAFTIQARNHFAHANFEVAKHKKQFVQPLETRGKQDVCTCICTHICQCTCLCMCVYMYRNRWVLSVGPGQGYNFCAAGFQARVEGVTLLPRTQMDAVSSQQPVQYFYTRNNVNFPLSAPSQTTSPDFIPPSSSPPASSAPHRTWPDQYQRPCDISCSCPSQSSNPRLLHAGAPFCAKSRPSAMCCALEALIGVGLGPGCTHQAPLSPSLMWIG